MQEHRTWIELSAKALWHNIATVKALSGTAQLGVVVKANAYGHGMFAIAQLLEHNPAVSWLFVAGTSEGIALRTQGITKPILALSYLDTPAEQAIAHAIAIVIYTLEDAQTVNAAAQAAGKQARIHIKIDTNMSRLGVMPDAFNLFLATIKNMPGLSIEGIFTHLSDTNNPDLSFTYEQLRLFDALIAGNADAQETPYKHVLASGSVMLEEKYDIIRAGTNIYGFWKSAIQQQRFEALVPGITFKPVLTWKTRIIQIKEIPAGASVGYNRTFQSVQPMVIATIAVGYFDGYPRHISNKGSVMVRGQLAPVIGMVSMNMTIIDITHIPEVELKDEVILLGDHAAVTATEVAASVGTINNELVARIHEQIPRIVIHDV